MTAKKKNPEKGEKKQGSSTKKEDVSNKRQGEVGRT